MNRRSWHPLSWALLLLCAATAAPAASSPPTDSAPNTAGGTAAFERFRGLAGEWVAAEDSQMVKKGQLVARYALTAGGSAVVETLLPGSDHEMVTVYTAEGKDVVLHHYCLNANAPRMRAKAPAGPRYEFAFDGGSNIQPEHTKHMHSAWIEFVGKDELKSEWTEVEHGKTALVVSMHTVRKTN